MSTKVLVSKSSLLKAAVSLKNNAGISRGNSPKYGIVKLAQAPRARPTPLPMPRGSSIMK